MATPHFTENRRNPTMPKIRINATLGLALAIPLWALAQDPAANPPAAPAEVAAKLTEGEKIVDRAVAKLREIKSASAKLEVVADMLNQKFRLDGDYKKAPGNRLFLLLTLVGSANSANSPGSSDRMLQVCDGVTLWDFNKVLDREDCTKRSIDKILKVLNSPDCDPKLREDMLSILGFVGPEAVLTGIRKSFVIDQVRDGTFEGKPVTILGGTWKDAKTPVMPGGGNPAFSGPLPPYVPTLVTIILGKTDGWPYQVVFEGRMPHQIEQKKKMADAQIDTDASGRAIGKRMTAPAAKPSKLTLTYTNVRINVPIPDEAFAFEPPKNARTRDETDLIVSQLEQAVAKSAETKKAQAAKAGPVLEGALPAPAPGDAPARQPSEAPK